MTSLRLALIVSVNRLWRVSLFDGATLSYDGDSDPVTLDGDVVGRLVWEKSDVGVEAGG